ncbi:MAG TPA: AMP-binding protein, partial [Stenomitos sp.]
MQPAEKVLAPQDNVFRYLSHWAQTVPDQAAIVMPGKSRPDGSLTYEQLSFAELEGRVNRLAAALKARGLERGDRVVVMIPMSVELYTLLLALLKMAVIIVFIDPWVGLDQIKRCIELTEPKAFAGIPLIQLLARSTGILKPIPMRLTARGQARFGELQLESLMNEAAPPVETERVEPDTTALITFTTGSTGTPKGANRTHGFLVAQHLALSREMGLVPGEVDLTTLPIFVLNNLAAGVTSVLPRMNQSKPSSVDPAVIVRQIQDYGPSTAVGSPAYWLPIATYCLDQGLQLPTIRSLFTGGGPVPPGLLEKLRQLLPNGQACIGYGSTEAEPIAIIGADEVCDETGRQTEAGRGNCVGHLAPGIELKVIRIVPGPVTLGAEGWHDLALPPGAIGELVVTGDHVGKDYYRNPEAVRENKIRDPEGRIWHRLGDVGYLDEKGRIWLVGRVNNVVTRGSKAIYPIQAEAIAHQLPFIEKAALVGLEDPALGHRVAFVVIPHEKHPVQWLRKRREWELR